MAEGLDSSVERWQKLLRPKLFIKRLLKRVSKFLESEGEFTRSEDIEESVRSLISTIRKFRKEMMWVMRKLLHLMTTLDVKNQNNLLLAFEKALKLLGALEIEDAMKPWNVFGRLKQFRLSELGKDGVNNGRSNDGVGPFRGEDSHVSSGNNEGRLDDHTGSKDVSAGPISVPHGGGIEEPERRAEETTGRADETTGPITVTSPTEPKLEPKKGRKSCISVQSDNHVSSVPDADGCENPAHGTDGLERLVQSVMVTKMRQVVDDLPNWKGRHEEFNLRHEEFNLESLLRNTSFSNQLNQITNNVRSEFPRLLQLREEIQDSSSEDLKADLKADLKLYCVPLCWSSTQRVEFFCHLSDRLYKPKVSGQQDNSQEDPLLKELESKSKRSFIFNEQWDTKVGDWMKKINSRFWPSNYESVECLLRFVRNRQHHPDEFQDSNGLRNAQTFYNYFDKQFDKRFSNLLMLSFRAVYKLCREEPRFKDYLPSQTI